MNKLAIFLAIATTCGHVAAAEDAASDLGGVHSLAIGEALAIPRAVAPSRSALHVDAIEHQIVTGTFTIPKAGDVVTTTTGQTTWVSVPRGTDGTYQHEALENGYLYLSYTHQPDPNRNGASPLLLAAKRHSMVYMDGTPRVGDVYNTGSVRIPFALREGTHHLLFLCRRGQVTVNFEQAETAPAFSDRDITKPDLLVGQPLEGLAAVVVYNASDSPADDLTIVASAAIGKDHAGDDAEGLALKHFAQATTTSVGPIPPMGLRKVPFRFHAARPDADDEASLHLTLRRGDEALSTLTVPLRVRRPEQGYVLTFTSAIDGSVQSFGLKPATGATTAPPALFLALHGAGVGAAGHLGAISAKPGGHIVTPTNRRSYGFDWEDWGRQDAIEVLDTASRLLTHDPARVYLLGHSMGGHGTYQIGAIYPDRFAALSPSAGWISFQSYVSTDAPKAIDPVSSILERAVATSDTLGLSRNYLHHGLFIVHGDKDDNVPVEQARTMREHLSTFHRDFTWHEQPGKGHWWDVSDEPGVDCVDLAEVFDFFARHRIPNRQTVRSVDFTTVNPQVSSDCHWVHIDAQHRQHEVSHVDLRCDPGRRRFVGTTENVQRMAIDVGALPPGKPLAILLDTTELADVPYPEKGARLWLTHEGDSWKADKPPSARLKGAHRYGPFKLAFGRGMVFVYGTTGTDEENRWSLAKARYDAETFWHRGNGSVDVIADSAFNPDRYRDRNVILYGNRETNSAWKTMLAHCPVQVTRDAVSVGQKVIEGRNLASLFVYPRADSDVALIGAVTGTGVVGMRLTDRLPYFVSGIGYPDFIVLDDATLRSTISGVRAAGYFGLDWRVETGDVVWRE